MATPIGAYPIIRLSMENYVAWRERERKRGFKHSQAHILHQ